ncbi:hypothetical protein CDD81_7222 [Ophiocordyceps australis]|uniref:Uncharacterized protein n=1 Tax=Ophiocordyceps australis TaxID=1399860 RepID=A0A2C5Y4K2_9HYPO|nr:hypothetical protein CDD81_7222 [Ophiocordyceps australis]
MAPPSGSESVGPVKSLHRCGGVASVSKPSKPSTTTLTTRRDLGSEEVRTKTKFREAMENPNWRNRSHGSSCSSVAEGTCTEVSDAVMVRARARGSSARLSVDSGVLEPDNISNRKVSELDRRFNTRQVAGSSFCLDETDIDMDKDGGTAEQNTLCRIVSQRQLVVASTEGRTLHLFELEPHDGVQARGFEDDYRNDGQMAVLQRLMKIPAEANVSLEAGHDWTSPSGEHSTDKAKRHSLQKSDDVADFSKLMGALTVGAAASQSTAALDKKLQKPGRATDDDKAGAEGKEKSQDKQRDFQKILDMLRRAPSAASTGGEAVGRSERKLGSDSGYGTSSASEGDRTRGIGHLLHSSMGAARRCDTVSDTLVNYNTRRLSSRGMEDSRGSCSSENESRRRNSLNPKAREFLSFGTESQAGRSFGSSSDETGQEGAGGGSSISEGGGPRSHEGAIGAIPFFFGTGAPILYPIDMRGGEVRPLVALPPLLNVANVFGSAAGSGGAAQADEAQAARQAPLGTTGWFGAFGRSNTPFHSLPARLHCPLPLPSMYAAPVAAAPPPAPAPVAGAFGRPMPVPKPKMPDTSKQQAYEAYIEHRKAMEPGYAMECRLRQQRRAKRTHVRPAVQAVKQPVG